MTDTVKRVQAGGVAETLVRDELVAVQTPQAFPVDVLRAAAAVGGDATDCAALVEARGGRVKVVEGDERLLKVTTAEVEHGQRFKPQDPKTLQLWNTAWSKIQA